MYCLHTRSKNRYADGRAACALCYRLRGHAGGVNGLSGQQGSVQPPHIDAGRRKALGGLQEVFEARCTAQRVTAFQQAEQAIGIQAFCILQRSQLAR